MASDLALIIGIGIISFILVYMSQMMNDDHEVLKWILNFFSLLLLLFIPSSLVELTTHKTSTVFYIAYIGFLVVFAFYLFAYFFVYRLMCKWGWIKKKDEKN